MTTIPRSLDRLVIYFDRHWKRGSRGQWIAVAQMQTEQHDDDTYNYALGSAAERQKFWADDPWWAADGETPEAAVSKLIEQQEAE